MPRRPFFSGARTALLGADRFSLIVRGQLRRQVDLTRKILAALDRVWVASHRILEDRALEDLLFRWLATRHCRDGPLHGQANVVVLR